MKQNLAEIDRSIFIEDDLLFSYFLLDLVFALKFREIKFE